MELKARVLESREVGGINICRELISCGRMAVNAKGEEGHGPYWYDIMAILGSDGIR
ncbi:MAG TPA: hypothetical protein PLM24_10185 [Methanothrix sp.]|nr:hypothetical protein [Methanothrix sp.]HPJ84496.1 hypothetical protein [Methanothrix sp.]HPR67489.1 hypothetical protein [Methanothrix sp.]